MLPRKYRVKAAEIDLIKKRGFLIKSRYFSVLVSDSISEQPSRFAFIVSTKISKLATKRNKIRRALSASVEKLYEKITPGKNVIFLTKQGIEAVSQDVIDEEVFKVFKYNKLI
jgi:ribonuclease P protein component